MDFTRDDIRRLFSSRVMEAGDAYRKQGRVLAYHSSSGEIHTRVRGGDQNPYKQTITIGLDRGKITIAGQCTCPVGYNCKHVAAALLYGLELPASVRLRGDPANPALPVPIAPPVLPDYAKRARQLVGTPVKAGPVSQALPPELASWLAGLELARVTAGEDYPPEIPYRIIYALCPVHTGNGIPRLAVQPLSTRLLKDGTLSASTHAFRPEQAFQNSPAKHLRPVDFKICRILRGLPSSWNDNVHMLVSEEGTAVLALILARHGRRSNLLKHGAILSVFR